METRDVGVAMA